MSGAKAGWIYWTVAVATLLTGAAGLALLADGIGVPLTGWASVGVFLVGAALATLAFLPLLRREMNRPAQSRPAQGSKGSRRAPSAAAEPEPEEPEMEFTRPAARTTRSPPPAPKTLPRMPPPSPPSPPYRTVPAPANARPVPAQLTSAPGQASQEDPRLWPEVQPVPRFTPPPASAEASWPPRRTPVASGPPPAPARPDPRRAQLVSRYTQRTPLVGSILRDPAAAPPPDQVPEVVGEVAAPGTALDVLPDGMVRGQCGGCSSVILGPSVRPVLLRCPVCQKGSLLQ